MLGDTQKASKNPFFIFRVLVSQNTCTTFQFLLSLTEILKAFVRLINHNIEVKYYVRSFK